MLTMCVSGVNDEGMLASHGDAAQARIRLDRAALGRLIARGVPLAQALDDALPGAEHDWARLGGALA